jgi:hypothetical protein
MIILLIVLILTQIGSLLLIRNLLQKVETYEEDIELKDQYLTKMQSLVDSSYEKMQTLDTLGAFESDDETGLFFTNLKEMSLGLKTYTQNYTK